MHTQSTRPSPFIFGALVVALLVLSPVALSAQTWVGVMRGLDAVPQNDSPATGSLTLTLCGDELLVQISWQDLPAPPSEFRLYTATPRSGWEPRGLALGLGGVLVHGDFKGKCTFTDRINLSEKARYHAAFLRAHDNRVETARDALVAQLDSGFVAVMLLPGPAMEIGGRLVRQPD